MKRFYEANASETPPKPPVNPSYGYPQNGNRAKNLKPTKLGAYWFHMITEEFMAVIEGAGLEPSETNLHQLADIFDDFRRRATASEEYKKAAEAAADRAEAAAQGVVTETAEKIKEIQEAGAAQVASINEAGSRVDEDVAAGIAILQAKLEELIQNLQTVGGQEASAVKSAAQAILDDITRVETNVESLAKQAQDSASSAGTSASSAGDSAAAAQSSASSAEAAKTAAESAKAAAQKSASSAQTSATAALGAKSAAEQSASEASQSASQAAVAVDRINAAAVLTTPQSLTPEQKAQAVANIGADSGVCPPGTLIAFAGKNVPEGFLLCNGAAVSRTSYARLYQAIGTLYGAGDGSTTFNLPDLNGRVLQGTNDPAQVGKYLEASLPRISGYIVVRHYVDYGADGSLFTIRDSSVSGGTFMGGAPEEVAREYVFSAQTASNLYAGDSLQPSALQSLACIRY